MLGTTIIIITDRVFVESMLASIDRRERLEQESLKRRQARLFFFPSIYFLHASHVFFQIDLPSSLSSTNIMRSKYTVKSILSTISVNHACGVGLWRVQFSCRQESLQVLLFLLNEYGHGGLFVCVLNEDRLGVRAGSGGGGGG